jgi:heme-degrading monooxygenase HmoA
MAVTELSMYPLMQGHDPLSFIEDLMQSLEAQDEWISQRYPQLIDDVGIGTANGNFSNAFIAKLEPSDLAITTQWDNLEHLQEWAESDLFLKVFGRMARHFSSDRPAYHMFTEPREEPGTGLPAFILSSPDVYINRISLRHATDEEEDGDAGGRMRGKAREMTLSDARHSVLKQLDCSWAAWEAQPLARDWMGAEQACGLHNGH